MMRRLLTLILTILFTLATHGQTNEKPDIDEWQVLKAEIAKDPFAHQNQFSINFAMYSDKDWCYPLRNGRLISPFGGKRRHAGTDIKTVMNDTVHAVFAGEVILSGPYYGYGNLVVIRHANGLETAYSHNSRNLVKKGDWVQPGKAIALEGRTGRATTHHVHFETRVNGKAFDSSKIFDHASNKLRMQKFVFTKQANGVVKITAEDPHAEVKK